MNRVRLKKLIILFIYKSKPPFLTFEYAWNSNTVLTSNNADPRQFFLMAIYVCQTLK